VFSAEVTTATAQFTFSTANSILQLQKLWSVTRQNMPWN